VVEGTRLFRVDDVAFVKEVVVAELRKRVYTMSVVSETGYECRRTLFRKKLPEMLISSQRTTTIFWPLRICLEMMEARRPSKWPLPSMTMGVEEKVAMSEKQSSRSTTRREQAATNRRT
jgi:hypothetical protein